MAPKQPKSDKRLKPKAILSFLRNVGLTKVVKEFSVWYLKWLKMGTFGKSAHIRVPKNGTLGAPMKILLPLLEVQHPPKIMELPFVLSVYHFRMGF